MLEFVVAVTAVSGAITSVVGLVSEALSLLRRDDDQKKSESVKQDNDDRQAH
jgi:hypothetical protein